ncbi:MAG TPA: toprim domain-containing protein [Thermoplasmata archaeon]|nr:toprim domain-containing protein [Thermoplasmata archaeon]
MILEVVEELEHMSGGAPIVVEGLKDVEALKRMGIKRNVVSLGKGLTVFAFCERMALRSGSAVILTDWDRKGGKLARMLKDALEANGVKANLDLRAKLVLLAKKDIKDIESLPKYIRRLGEMANRP